MCILVRAEILDAERKTAIFNEALNKDYRKQISF